MNRTHRVCAALVVGVLALAGCGTAQSGSGGAESDPSGTTLKWWAWNAAESETTIAEFEKQNPGITVEFTAYSNDDYLNNLRAALTSDKGPDVLQLAPGGTVNAYGDLVQDLAPLAATAWGEDWRSGFNELGLTQLQKGGKQAALPSYMSAAGFLYYNSGILGEAGAEVPTDLDQMVSVCEKVRAAGYDCLAHGAKDAWVNLDVYLALMNSIEPGLVYRAIDGTEKWTDPRFVEGMDAWRSLFTGGIIAPGAVAVSEYPDASTAFLEGKAAFIALGTWNTPATMTKTGLETAQKSVSTTIDSTFLSTAFPAARAGGTPTRAFGGPDNGWAISSKSRQQEAAWKFVSFLAGKEGQAIQASVGNFPALTSVPVSTDDVIVPEQAADIQRQEEELAGMVGYRQIPYPDLEAALGQALGEVAAGTSNPQDALAQVETVSSALSR